MDRRLHETLKSWQDQIQVVERAEETYLTLEANRKPLWSSLFLGCPKTSVAEREALAYAHEDFRAFLVGLCASEVALNKEKRVLDLKIAAHQAEYLSAKHESESIARMPRAIT